jgi:2-C-methyl-D-erythritol 4-phosphate cytidylyltransferase
VVAAGRSSRFGRPKQYVDLCGRRVLDWSVSSAKQACDGVVVVLPPGDLDGAAAAGADAVCAGGLTRSGSVRAGMAAVPGDAEIIVVHDAARPLARAELWSSVIAAVAEGADAAVPGVPVNDTIKRLAPDGAVETLDRSRLVAVHTPQAFRAAALRAAHGSGAEASDDAALIEAAGGRVVVVPGDQDNAKLTGPGDLDVLSFLMTRRLAAGTGP